MNGRALPEREFDVAEEFARSLDSADRLAEFRRRFLVPVRADGNAVAYLCGNSLGLQPVGAARAVCDELEDWAGLAVDAHFAGKKPWYGYHERFREPLGRLVGARPDEVVVMNGLTVNLHLMLVSFYRPTAQRYKILIEENPFPSDLYAVQSQLRYHGHDPARALLVARARPGESTLRTEDVEALIEREGSEIALILFGGVNYLSGQWFDLQRITATGHRLGCTVGFDLAHAVGNVPLSLHDQGVDFAVWCSYKYLNAGPGAAAGCFVHARHLEAPDLPRFAGWWGNDPRTRFRMQAESGFVPVPSADGWQLSNPPILALAPLESALALFDEAGMDALREKSSRLTGYLESWIRHVGDRRVTLVTPADPRARGCQLSLRVSSAAAGLFDALKRQGIVCDCRDPDVLRVAPVPLYNGFHDVWRFGRVLERWAAER